MSSREKTEEMLKWQTIKFCCDQVSIQTDIIILIPRILILDILSWIVTLTIMHSLSSYLNFIVNKKLQLWCYEIIEQPQTMISIPLPSYYPCLTDTQCNILTLEVYLKRLVFTAIVRIVFSQGRICIIVFSSKGCITDIF